MTASTIFPIIMIALIAAILVFWLVFPETWVAASLNAFGNAIEWVVSKIKALFSKKSAPAPTAEILPVNPPSAQNTAKTLTKNQCLTERK
jgi:hypothetical protein